MRQTILSAVIEVQPACADRLRALITALRDDEEAPPLGAAKYSRVRTAIPVLQFMSMTVCNDDKYDPILVIECNFDGAPGPFWAQLEAVCGTNLRNMIRCCQRPAGDRAALYDSVTAPGATSPIAPFLEAFTVLPAIFHIGNRGLARERIEREAALFGECQDQLKANSGWRALTATEVHARLRAALQPRFRWLDQPDEPRISRAENIADIARLVGFGIIALLVLVVPGLLLAAALPGWVFPLLAGIATLWAVRVLARLAGDPAIAAMLTRLLLGAVFGFAAISAVSALAWRISWLAIATAGLCSIATVIALVLAWIRILESNDPPQTAPRVEDRSIRAMNEAEDKITQNHMISIVHIKPGVLRAVLIRADLWGLGLYLRVSAHDGYLASMRTIHFAHWAIISNGGRLMFHSNFDGTWESYLDDFIEKAHGGLTLAGSNGVGFPPTRFLFLDGVTQGRAFKTWARHSMTASLFWFSAHRDFTVNQIERQFRLADGLRAASLPEGSAATWARGL
jgi:hypothetical protein